MPGKTPFWTDERIRRLLACDDHGDLRREFPGKGIANLVNRRALFRKSRPDLMPAEPPPGEGAGYASVSEMNAGMKDPKGWEAGVELKGDTGTLCSGTVDAPVEDWDELLKLWNLDPETFEVVEPVTFKAWDMGIKNPAGEIETKRLYSYKATVRRRVPGVDPRELERLRSLIDLAPAWASFGDDRDLGGVTFAVCLADWQIGKGEGGGTDATVARLESALGATMSRLYASQASRGDVTSVALLGLGDLFESCAGFYDMQEYQTDRTRREQTNVLRRMILRYVREFASTGLPLRIAAVGGNHGENRRGGKAYTTFGDNDDVAIFEQVKDIVDTAPDKFGNPEWQIAGDNLDMVVELSGIPVGLAHGHQFGSGARKSINWWQKQALGNQKVGSAHILLSGHFHNLELSSWSERTHIQVPAMDGGSEWFRRKHGAESPAGMVSLLIGTSLGPLGWSSLSVVSP